ncbi:exo-alpha-sialidase [Trypanosoma cruzi]|nr:exo-alpha-sialidase [Trypanosoma cruzi]
MQGDTQQEAQLDGSGTCGAAPTSTITHGGSTQNSNLKKGTEKSLKIKNKKYVIRGIFRLREDSSSVKGGLQCPTRQPVTPHRAANPHSPNRRTSDGSTSLPNTVPPPPCAPLPRAATPPVAPAAKCSAEHFGRDTTAEDVRAATLFGIEALFALSAVIPLPSNGRLYSRTFVTFTDTPSLLPVCLHPLQRRSGRPH